MVITYKVKLNEYFKSISLITILKVFFIKKNKTIDFFYNFLYFHEIDIKTL